MKTDHIKTALVVAQTGHFNRAGEVLFMTDNGVFYHIAQLEKELGFRLFDRWSGKQTPMQPTERGADWLKRAKAALELLVEDQDADADADAGR